MAERPKILIIDDAPEICRFYSTVLTQSGFEVLLADDGLKGIFRAETDQPHLIMLDLRLPDSDGLQVLNKLRSKDATRNIPVIVFTGSASKQKVEEATYLGANAFIFKGMMPIKQLVDKIRSLILPAN
jgi:CheY-like chemotaxis protein